MKLKEIELIIQTAFKFFMVLQGVTQKFWEDDMLKELGKM